MYIIPGIDSECFYWGLRRGKQTGRGTERLNLPLAPGIETVRPRVKSHTVNWAQPPLDVRCRRWLRRKGVRPRVCSLRIPHTAYRIPALGTLFFGGGFLPCWRRKILTL